MDHRIKAALLVAAMTLGGGVAAAEEAGAEAGAATQPGASVADDDAIQKLIGLARKGEGDPHLPYVLIRLKTALAGQNLVDVLRLIQTEYFDEQFALLARTGRSPGDRMNQFACELFSVCDISKDYDFADIVSADVLGVSPEGGLTGDLVEVTVELRMWDGVTLVSTIYYDPNTARLLGGRG